ncbi:pilus assembly protein TadG-related protein [Vibrio scophthalmi]|uniref:TadE/TadG family type IV pilus assembly protein n=1 Tax=Vibrio scophthalmi TaxID=45658 RepID=UPI003AAEE4CA
MVVLNKGVLKRKQQGITLVLISLVMLFLLGMAAFSIDLNHQVLNKTRLQNAVDSAALAGAVVVDETGDVALAETAARETLTNFIGEDGNSELGVLDGNTVVTFSSDLETFVAAGAFSPSAGEDDIYVRVATTDIELNQFLSYIFGIDKNVSASAVAGRSASISEVCNLTPIAMCGDPLGSATDAWGYQQPGVDILNAADNSPDQIHELKIGSQGSTDMGPGNFHLLDFSQPGGNGQGGAALVREALAGGYDGCAIIGNTVTTKPGNSIGPVAQGLNTRLNNFKGPMKDDGTYLPDKYVKEPDIPAEPGEEYTDDFYYSNYVQELASCASGGSCDGNNYLGDAGSNGRRILRIPIVDCTDAGGKTNYDVLGFGCFFLLQSVEQTGNASVFGQFLYDCMINNGSTGLDPDDAGLYRIQLYKDPFSGAS